MKYVTLCAWFLTVDGHLDSFPLLAVGNSATVNIPIQIFLNIYYPFSWVYNLEWHFWIIQWLANYFPQWLYQRTFLQAICEGSNVCTHSAMLLISGGGGGVLITATPVGAKWNLIVVVICLSLMTNNVGIFSCAFGHFYNLFREVCGEQVHWPFFSWVVYLLVIGL